MVKLQHFQFTSSRSQIENSKIQTSLPSPYLLKTASVERSFHIVTFVFNSNMAHFVSQTQDDQSPFSSEEESPKKPRFLPSQEHLELCAIDPRKNAFFNNHFDTAISNCREQASLISVRSHQRKMPRSSSKGKKKMSSTRLTEPWMWLPSEKFYESSDSTMMSSPKTVTLVNADRNRRHLRNGMGFGQRQQRRNEKREENP